MQQGKSKRLLDNAKVRVEGVVSVDKNASPRMVQVCVAKQVVMALLVQEGAQDN